MPNIILAINARIRPLTLLKLKNLIDAFENNEEQPKVVEVVQDQGEVSLVAMLANGKAAKTIRIVGYVKGSKVMVLRIVYLPTFMRTHK